MSDGVNWSLFLFLAYRCNTSVLRSVLEAEPSILDRTAWTTEPVVNDPRIKLYARALSLGLLNPLQREDAASRLQNAVAESFDLSFFEDETVMNSSDGDGAGGVRHEFASKLSAWIGRARIHLSPFLVAQMTKVKTMLP